MTGEEFVKTSGFNNNAPENKKNAGEEKMDKEDSPWDPSHSSTAVCESSGSRDCP